MIIMVILLKEMKIMFTSLIITCACIMGIHYLLLFHLLRLLNKLNRDISLTKCPLIIFRINLLNKPIYCRLHD